MSEESKILHELEKMTWCSAEDQGYLVGTHCLFPSGDNVCVYVNKTRNGYLVRDNSLGLRELYSSGIELNKSLLKRAITISESMGGTFEKGQFLIKEVSDTMLAAAIVWLANTIQKWVSEAVYENEIKKEEQLKFIVNESLNRVFMGYKIEKNVPLVGHSTKKYAVDNIVYPKFGGKPIIIDVILNHQNAISSSYLKHSDLKKNAVDNFIHEGVIDEKGEWKTENINILADVFDGIVKSQNLDSLKKYG